MTNAEFEDQIKRLGERWRATYTPELVKLIWREVSQIEAQAFTRMIDRLIGECRQAPLLPDFREALAREREAAWSRRQVMRGPINWNEFAKCEFCGDLGVYLCTHKTMGGRWAFRCHCVKGEQDTRTHIPQFKADHAKEFVYYEVRRDAIERAKG